jgi:hypothetical protein
MAIFWLTPAAWWGLGMLAVPVAIHLLTRQQTRRVPFPTLRFLHATRLAALRRRSIHDWPLLLVRSAILVAAVAALAAPVFVSAARRAEWETRIVRALVVTPMQAEPSQLASVLTEESRTSVASAVFRPATTVADGLRDGADWLERQPPGAREVVIVGDLREGALADPDLATLLPATGVRFVPMPDNAAPTATVEFAFGSATLVPDRTTVVYNAAAATGADVILVRAARADIELAEAARAAVLARGVRTDRAGARRVLVVFDGADTSDLQLKQPAAAAWMREALAHLPGMSGGQHGDMLVVLAGQPARGVETVHVIDRAARAAFAEDLRAFEPRRVPASMLAKWSRAPRPDPDAPLSDEGDRRWLWGLALTLVAIESLLRRSSRPAAAEEPPVEEQRVA